MSASPVSETERVDALDVVRAVALLGVLVVNLLTIFRVGIFEQFLYPRGFVTRAVAAGLEMKAFILFSFLFGVGLAVQSERTRARGGSFAVYAARRLGFLLALGLAHLFLVWNGDILTLYAVVGVVAAPLLRLPTWALVALALVLFVVQFAPLPYPTPFASTRAMTEHVQRARMIYGHGGFGDVLAFRIAEVRPISALLVWSAPRTLGLFLLGACVWRWRILLPPRSRTLFAALGAVGIVSGGAMIAFSTDGGGLVGGEGATILALGYGAAIVALLDTPVIGRALAWLAPLGRMALTSYLTQSVVLGFVFYGYGLGLFGRLGELEGLALALGLYAAQAVASAAWLARFRFGPVEWLWRSFTYGALQPMRR
jgi:uncharacterized protein